MNTDFISIYFMGEKKLALMSYNLFETDVKENLSTLDQHFSENQTIEYAKLLHKWKPNFKMFGNRELSDELQRLETGLKESRTMLNEDNHKTLMSEISSALDMIKRNLN